MGIPFQYARKRYVKKALDSKHGGHTDAQDEQLVIVGTLSFYILNVGHIQAAQLAFAIDFHLVSS